MAAVITTQAIVETAYTDAAPGVICTQALVEVAWTPAVGMSTSMQQPYLKEGQKWALKPKKTNRIIEKESQADPLAGINPAAFGSSLEATVYKALLRAGWDPEQITMQKWIYGGRAVKGGLVIDFVLYAPFAIPISVNGEYWHKNKDIDALENARILEYFGRLPVVIWGDEAEDDEEALATVIRKIGRG